MTQEKPPINEETSVTNETNSMGPLHNTKVINEQVEQSPSTGKFVF
jgi:hypothetical protein